MKHYLSVVILAICLVSCKSHSCHWETLSQVESYIEEKPDSALVTLEQIDLSELSGKKEKAKYALLYSMALDKNFVDKADFEVLQPAIDYYKDSGSATDKLRTYYYQGRIYQNMGNDALAMAAFVHAIEEGVDSDDMLTTARTYFAQSKIYYSLYEWDSFIESNKYAAQLFQEAGVLNSYANCLIRIINGYTLKEDPENALFYIEECKKMLGSISLGRLGDFYSSYLTYLVKYGTEQEIEKVIQDYMNAVPACRIDWLTVANSYIKIKRYNEALESVAQCSNDDEITNGLKYQAIISEIYQHLGRYKESLYAYQKYMAASDSADYAVMRQDTRFVEERHQLELQTLTERESKKRVLLFAAIFIMLLLGVILWICARLKVNRMEKSIAEQEREKYRSMYEQMEYEKDNLSELLSHNSDLDNDIRGIVAKRIELLNKFFTAYITNNSEVSRKADKELDELLANKESFMSSTRLAFAGSHPNFIKYLEKHNLSEREIEYCCLYALGLKGKDVGSYIKMRSHFNISSDVRKKLGLAESETNLGIYIRKQLLTL